MYIKSNAAHIARRVAVPPTLYLLRYVRPDFLLARCLARGLIMWDAIEPTEEW